jgi:putative hydrolase of the HAD superfamily
VLTDCVILDLDDTLFLERDYVVSGFRAVGRDIAARYGVAGFDDAAIRLFATGVRGTTFNRALEDVGISPTDALVAELVAAYRSHAPAIELLPDAQRLIDALGGRYLGVVTDGPLESQRAKAAAVGAPGWADLIVYTAELGPGFGKPHPLGFSLHEDRARQPGTRFSYVADNPAKDFAGPKSRGWTTIRIRRPESLHAAVPSGSDVDVEIATLDELLPTGTGGPIT